MSIYTPERLSKGAWIRLPSPESIGAAVIGFVGMCCIGGFYMLLAYCLFAVQP